MNVTHRSCGKSEGKAPGWVSVPRAAAGAHPGWVANALRAGACALAQPCSVHAHTRAPPGCLRSVLPGGVVLERGEAAQAQPRGVLRRGGREHCVKEDEDEYTQLQPGGAQSRGRGHCERRPGTGVSSVHGPFGWGCGLLLAPDVTAFGFIIG